MKNHAFVLSMIIFSFVVSPVTSAFSFNPLSWFKKENTSYLENLETSKKNMEALLEQVAVKYEKVFAFIEIQPVNITYDNLLKAVEEIQTKLIDYIKHEHPNHYPITKMYTVFPCLYYSEMLSDDIHTLSQEKTILEKAFKKYKKHTKRPDSCLVKDANFLLETAGILLINIKAIADLISNSKAFYEELEKNTPIQKEQLLP